MLRAYRATFMGAISERWSKLADISVDLRVPVALLVAGLLWFGFFPQPLVRIVEPTFRTYFTATK